MSGDPRDPRSQAEKARADLKRNAEMELSLTQTPLEREPSVTPQTFGVHEERTRLRSGIDQGLEAGGHSPESEAGEASSRVESERVAAGRDRSARARGADDERSDFEK